MEGRIEERNASSSVSEGELLVSKEVSADVEVWGDTGFGWERSDEIESLLDVVGVDTSPVENHGHPIVDIY